MPKQKLEYWKRYDLMFKNYSKKDLVLILEHELIHNCLVPRYIRGRRTIVRKERIISFILVEKQLKSVYRDMEMEGEVYLLHKYDHSSFQYHYKALPETILYRILSIFEKKCKVLLNEIFIHLVDSTAQSSSVREERLRQGTRNKEKITDKIHTLLGYDPPNKIVIVESALASDKHLSDGKGAESMISKHLKGYLFGDAGYETYDLIDLAFEYGLIPIIKPQNKNIKRKLSKKAQLRKIWNGNNKRLYKEIRGVAEVLYGGATKANLLKTNSKLTSIRRKDALILSIRQNLFSFLRLKALIRIYRQTHFFHKVYKLSLIHI